MYQFLNIRSRLLQATILGLVILTYYAYYFTVTNDVQQTTAARFYNRSPHNDTLRTGSNISTETQSTTSLKNMTAEPLNLNTNVSHNMSHPPTLITTLPSSSSSQSPAKVVNQTTSIMPPINNASARAIYQSGHTVAIPERCPNLGKGLELAIMIMSAPNHFEARTAIRQTWGHYGQRKDISILFMLGNTTDPKVEEVLRQEQEMYSDIVRGNFLDSYSNLTLKTISTLEWVENYCSNVKFVLKTDDDMFINVPRLLSFISKHAKDKNIIFGRLAKRWKPIRNQKSKYYVSQVQYKPAVFPDFTTGPAYLMSIDVVHKLYNACLDQTYLKLEDVFATGIVAHKLGIKRSHVNEFLNKRIPFNPCNIQRGISIHMVKYSEQFDLWKKLLDGKVKCK